MYVVLLINASDEIAHVIARDDPIPDAFITEARLPSGEREKFRVVRCEVDFLDHIRAREWLDNLSVDTAGKIKTKTQFRGKGFMIKSDKDERGP